MEGITVPLNASLPNTSTRVIDESSQDEMQVGDEVPLFFELGKTRCEFCKRDFMTTKALRDHNKKLIWGKLNLNVKSVRKDSGPEMVLKITKMTVWKVLK